MAEQSLRDGNAALYLGLFDQAIQCFRHSMIIASQAAVQEQAQDPLDQPVHHNALTAIQCVSLNLEDVLSPSSETISSHNIFDIFDRAFYLNNDVADGDDHNGNSTAEASVVCIYNIGLTHHLQGIMLPRQHHRLRGATYHFHRAQHFYALALKGLHGIVDPRDPDDPLLLLHLALLNNMGHLHCHFAEAGQVQTTLRCMMAILPDFLRGQRHRHELCDLTFFRSYFCCAHVLSLHCAAEA